MARRIDAGFGLKKAATGYRGRSLTIFIRRNPPELLRLGLCNHLEVMLADDGLGIASLQGGGPDALELGTVVGDEGMAQDIVAELELLPEAKRENLESLLRHLPPV